MSVNRDAAKDREKSQLLTLDQLEDQLSYIERTLVILSADEDGPVYPPYRLKLGSPGSMRGRQLKAQIEQMYPGVEAQVLSLFLTLDELRRKTLR